jgi:transketolase
MTFPTSPNTPLDERSMALRRTVLQMLTRARRGHVGSAFSLIEILRVLYDDVLRYDPTRPKWERRDRCILSKGHGCLALYALLADKGFFPVSELEKFCASDGILGGHPDAGKVPGVEASTGALGHGLNIGIGFALNARLVGNGARVFAILGDGECNEGSIWEGAMCSAKHKLDNLVTIVDYNKHQSYGPTAEVQELEPFAAKWASFGFAVREVDGHDVVALRALLSSVPFEPGRPSALICHTIKGKGVSFAENNMAWHHKAKISDPEMIALTRALEVA